MYREQLVAAFAMLFISSPAVVYGEESNQTEVRENLARDGFQVIPGKMFTEGEWAAGAASLYASVQAGNPAPFFEWMGRELEGSVVKIQQQLPGVARDQILRLIQDSLRDGKVVQINGLDIQAGIATYKRWKEIGAHYPEFYGLDVEWTFGKTKVPLPNWHQPYIRFRVHRGNLPKPGDFGPSPPSAPNPGGEFRQRSFPIFPQSIKVTCHDKQEGSGDNIYLIIKPDGQLRNVQQVAGIGPQLKWKMFDGDTQQVGRSGLEMLDFVRYLEITIVEYDSLSDNEVLGTVYFEPGKLDWRTIEYGRPPRKCTYTVTVDARVQRDRSARRY